MLHKSEASFLTFGTLYAIQLCHTRSYITKPEILRGSLDAIQKCYKYDRRGGIANIKAGGGPKFVV
jgi:hypothetical protein